MDAASVAGAAISGDATRDGRAVVTRRATTAASKDLPRRDAAEAVVAAGRRPSWVPGHLAQEVFVGRKLALVDIHGRAVLTAGTHWGWKRGGLDS